MNGAETFCNQKVNIERCQKNQKYVDDFCLHVSFTGCFGGRDSHQLPISALHLFFSPHSKISSLPHQRHAHTPRISNQEPSSLPGDHRRSCSSSFCRLRGSKISCCRSSPPPPSFCRRSSMILREFCANVPIMGILVHSASVQAMVW